MLKKGVYNFCKITLLSYERYKTILIAFEEVSNTKKQLVTRKIEKKFPTPFFVIHCV